MGLVQMTCKMAYAAQHMSTKLPVPSDLHKCE